MEMVKIDTPSVAKIDAGECGSKGNSETESWIVQVQQRYNCGEYKRREASSSVCIYRVPESIRNINEEAYDPLVVSLGPYHRKKHLSAMDDYKLQAVEKTLRRLHPMTMNDLITEVTQLETQIRDCYEDSAIDWNGNTLVWMMTMDACFILEFFRQELPNSSTVKRNVKKGEMEIDILKMENQIPFFVLEKILGLEFKGSENETMFLANLLYPYWYFKGWPFRQVSKNKFRKLISERRPYHLLDLCRMVIADFLQDSCSPRRKYGNVSHIVITRWPHLTDILPCLFRSVLIQETIASAEKLARAGIKCKRSPDGKVQFKRRFLRHSTLFLHGITVEDSTEIFLRNLMAFEECQIDSPSPNENIISLYIRFMDNLIDSKEDVELLRKHNIIRNLVGSDEEVATIFNNLCRGITVGESGFTEIAEMANLHYGSPLNVLMSQFKEEHCSKPWYIISIVAAVLLLGMTCVQTLSSVENKN